MTNLNDERVADHVLDREDVDPSQRREVLTDGRIPTLAIVCAMAKEVTTGLVEGLVESRLEAGAGVVQRAYILE